MALDLKEPDLGYPFTPTPQINLLKFFVWLSRVSKISDFTGLYRWVY